ncbi:SusE domain-containing protein [Seonamhaeicola sp.]|uniref:SusE domain-containing protein n=1 Tax=Seonamhaeicola sp. TaxID=1912245 RepID=UPI002620EFED|nr:SusE domain-containing protein [Seonamhaeicola sp.]
MKISIKQISRFILGLTLLFMACETEETLNITTAEPVFELKQPSISNINLNPELPDNPAFTIVWTDELSDGGSTYTVELSTDPIAFESPMTLGTSNSNRFSMSVAEFNEAVIGAGVPAFEPFAVFMRISSGSLISNVVSFSVSSYAETPPVITSPDNTFEVVLSDVAPSDTALTVEWDDPDFGENATVEISYALEFSEAGSDFATVFTVEPEENNGATSMALSHETLNEAALNSGLTAEEAGQLDIRVKASIALDGGDMVRYSEGITITVTPYDVVLPPVLYIVGAGVPDAGWSWNSPVELTLSGSRYGGNVNFSPDNGGNFRFFTDASLQWASPSQNFPYYEDRGYTIDSNFQNANDGDLNFQFVGTAGLYYLEIDTENRTITLGDPRTGPNCEHDQLWLVGAGVPDAGWAWTSPVELPCTGNGIYSGAVRLQNNGGADNNFRFFTDRTLEWGSPSFNYPHYENAGYSIDSNFMNAGDGDSNFAFVGTSGDYILTINDTSKTITLEPISCALDQLWLVGAGVPDAGWGWGSPVALPCFGDGVYSGNVLLQNNNGADNNFRFFTIEGDWGSGQNYPYYEGEGYTIDSNFANAGDGDSNFAFIGTTGTYKLTVDTMAKTITLEEVAVPNCDLDQLWLVGAGVPDAGWGWDTPVALPCTGNGTYSGNVTFGNDAFRFFTTEGDWGSGLNYPYYEGEGYTIDSDFANAMDGDSNFLFNGTPGTYLLTVDTVNKTITLQ